jgi:hypothetical protein
MRTIFASIAALVLAGSLVAAQTNPPSKKDAKDADDKPITLSGCVGRDGNAPHQFTLADERGTVIYRLTGTDVRDYIGKHVEVIGGTPVQRKLKIAGGLLPSPNAAAQAGAMDPAQAAMAAAGGVAGPGDPQLPEFKVRSVRPVSGNCPG